MPGRQKTRYSILGLLTWQPMSGYEIKKLVEMGLRHFWSESYGQLYPTLNQLVADGLALRKEDTGTGRRKRHLYSITAKGRRAVLAWLREPTDPPSVRNEMQLKFFLTGRLDEEEGIRLIEEYRAGERSRYEEYSRSETILRTAVQARTLPEELVGLTGPDDDSNQLLVLLLTLRHGMLITEARLAWCEESLKALRSRRRSRATRRKSK